MQQNAECNRDSTLFAIHSKRASPVEMATEVTEEAVDVLAATSGNIEVVPKTKGAAPRSRGISPQPPLSRQRTPEVTACHGAKRDGMVSNGLTFFGGLIMLTGTSNEKMDILNHLFLKKCNTSLNMAGNVTLKFFDPR